MPILLEVKLTKHRGFHAFYDVIYIKKLHVVMIKEILNMIRKFFFIYSSSM